MSNDLGQLLVSLLGTFRVESDDGDNRLPTRKANSLFAYLILHPVTHSREKIVTLVWEDSPNPSSRGLLRNAQTFLRNNIHSKIFITTKDTVQLNPHHLVKVGVRRFEEQVQWLLSAEAVSPRQRYRDQYFKGLLRAVELANAQSEHQQEIDFAQALVFLARTIERTYQHIMFCYMTLGEFTKALQLFDIYQAVLQKELGVYPTSETLSLYQWITQTNTGVLFLAGQITNLPIPVSSFAGHRCELSNIKKLLRDTQLVILTGLEGSGKTQLAIHAATDLTDSIEDVVSWVKPAPVPEPALVQFAVAKALGLEGPPDQPKIEIPQKHLCSGKALTTYNEIYI